MRFKGGWVIPEIEGAAAVATETLPSLYCYCWYKRLDSSIWFYYFDIKLYREIIVWAACEGSYKLVLCPGWLAVFFICVYTVSARAL